MRKGFLGSLSALLAGTAVAFAEPPATSDPATAVAPNGIGQPTTVTPPRAAGAPAMEAPRSPYWPNPYGYSPVWGAPAVPHGGVADDRPHGSELITWGSAEYLLWWVKNQPLGIPLVTTGTPTGLGNLGSPDTAVLYGGSNADYHTFSGGRFTLGFGFGRDAWADWGVEGSGFFVEKRPATFFASSSVTGVPVLARPFINALDGTETQLLISDPGVPGSPANLAGGVARGSVAVTSFSDVYGWDVDIVHGWYRDGPLHVKLLGGFRYINMSEDLNIFSESTLLPGGTAGFAGTGVVPPSTVAILDHYGTRNEFYGGQLGARADYSAGCWVFSALGKIALGNTHEVIDLSGFTSRTGPGVVNGLNPAGLLVLSSNRGVRAHDEFAVVPEIGINVGYQVFRSLRVFAGYTFLYLSDVARPGDQISRTVNPNIVPASTTFGTATGPAQPSFTFNRTDFWAQGANVGFEIRY